MDFPGAGHARQRLNLGEIDNVSRRVREVLLRYSPEIVAAAEGFASQVVYLPVSATGCDAEVDPQTGARGFRLR